MQKQKSLFLILPLLLLCTVHNTFAENTPTPSEDPCAIEAKKPPHKRSPRNPIDWACMRQQAAKGNQFQQYYVGIHLAYGTSLEGKGKASEGIKLLTNIAKHGKNKNSAMQILARIYWSGKNNIPKNINLAYQWALLSKFPVKEEIIIRGSHYKEDMAKASAQPTIMKQIERQYSKKHIEQLKKLAPTLLK